MVTCQVGGVKPIGPKIAEGRDSEIFEHGSGRVLRVARDGRSLENVMMTPDGPMVIDWANASAGDPAFDVADTWVLFARGTAPLSGVDRWIVPIGRRVLLRSFFSRVDTASARRAIPAAVEHRLTDPNMSTQEQARMRRFAAGVKD